MRKLTEEEAPHALRAAQQIWQVMSRLNSTDIYPLCADDPADRDSVYHHLTQALRALCSQLGMDPDEAMADIHNSYDIHDTYVRLTGVMV